MISEVDISHLGIIESARLELGSGFTAVTGETGAGKTLVLTAIGLLLGQRADSHNVQNHADKAQVDGVFVVAEEDLALQSVLEESGLDLEEDELLASRTVMSNGRSRARLQGRPVPAAILAEVAEQLVTIHGQSDQVALRSTQVQREILDRCGGAELASLKATYQQAWQRAVEAKRRLDEWSENAHLHQLEAESLREGCQLVAALDPAEDEEEELKAKIDRLTHATDLRMQTVTALRALRHGDSDIDAITLLEQALVALRQAQHNDASLGEISENLDRLLIEITDLSEQIADYSSQLESDPSALSAAHERRAQLTRAMRGRATTVKELLDWAEQAQIRLELIGDPESTTATYEAELKTAQQRVIETGKQLSAKRIHVAAQLSSQVTAELDNLALQDAHFEAVLVTQDKPKPYGLEDVVFSLQPHPEATLRPLAQGASGGELSRVMLALEVVAASLTSKDTRHHTFIFDEVDSGIGGQAAVEVGARLAQLAQNHQVIVVTHVPQVAAYADQHVLVSKADNRTELTTLSEDERVQELARMLSGDSTPDVARAHALELLNAARMKQS
ncbi:DNA repair protein RecN [Boudabousia marimammalium]|uniref:DNA repair protein RecN n=1 Tax=Boudabousia marimammalium TaxID=156892 RepID=A0A1Q5PRN2_9ACTO|nr:DNA repair protein RecN [Boudabousia marimammalium]OKL50080.1 DNA repair protein RecN [Boudabousia marimammalium]